MIFKYKNKNYFINENDTILLYQNKLCDLLTNYMILNLQTNYIREIVKKTGPQRQKFPIHEGDNYIPFFAHLDLWHFFGQNAQPPQESLVGPEFKPLGDPNFLPGPSLVDRPHFEGLTAKKACLNNPPRSGMHKTL